MVSLSKCDQGIPSDLDQQIGTAISVPIDYFGGRLKFTTRKDFVVWRLAVSAFNMSLCLDANFFY